MVVGRRPVVERESAYTARVSEARFAALRNRKPPPTARRALLRFSRRGRLRIITTVPRMSDRRDFPVSSYPVPKAQVPTMRSGGDRTMSPITQSETTPRRGDDTRERLLDAVEELIANHGFLALTHRLIAQRAEVHVALLNYHFGSKEQLIEEALLRRAPRLMQLQKEGLAALRSSGVWTVEDVLWAIWQPFAVLDASADGAWRNYLCLVARLASYDKGNELYARHFAPIESECVEALRRALPAPTREELARGLEYCRLLFERELMTRCSGCAGDPADQRRRSERLIAFLAGGLRALEQDGARTTG
jgi:AcrR family transcriptional regulator